MRIDEITAISDRDMSEQHCREQIRLLLNYRDWTLLADLSDVKYRWRDQGRGSKDVLIIHDKKAVGYAILHATECAGITGFNMTEIGLSSWEREGNGFGARLYDVLLDQGITLFSGVQQTRSGRNMWERLMKRPGVEVSAIVDDKVVPLDGVDPWSSQDISLMARKG